MMEIRNTNNQINNNNNNNAIQNSRQQNYQNNRGSITGLCERSVADHYNKIESNFLEKYLKYIVIDDFIPDVFEYNLEKYQQNNNKYDLHQSIFQVANNFQLYTFIEQLRAELKKNSNVSQNQLIIECFGQDHLVQQGDQVFIICSIKITNSKLKKLPEAGIELLQKAVKNEKVLFKENQLVHMTIFYNGDINFDFDQYPDQYQLGEKLVEINKVKVRLVMNLFYISKVALFQHFVVRNNYKIETIDDKTITFYELTRTSFKQRQITKLQIERQKQNQNQSVQEAVNNKKIQANSSSLQKGVIISQNNKKNKKIQQLAQEFFQKNKKLLSMVLLSAGAISIYIALKKILKKKLTD
ncbi:transmembrane protein, putative (macronuclear) [Tetrahymena thermophila SB210]|uniref:Transmembrane protein, putative n=1 Tax=Tetrahymena thermophila (strain SB210) TaxID=312017 RepID=W7X201_TETTS|nr:transmembrane protein, putative [Tetrahymena thermophila SB210]EWS73260.1 transmembrane protein, putative [Tetrahymena thermophila SB210]|eukprot:XP_012654169.1 transmembrane protein, putative [Tetrahymena thermophila SB210]